MQSPRRTLTQLWTCRLAEPFALQRLLEAVEAAKRRLSAADSAEIELPFWGGGQALSVRVARRDFEAATEQLRRRLWPPLRRLGEEAFLHWADRWVLFYISCICACIQLRPLTGSVSKGLCLFKTRICMPT